MQYRSSLALRDFLLTSTALVAALAAGSEPAAAQLSKPQVQAGQVTVTTPTATSTVITQSTNKAILNWSAFSIPSGSSVQFVQPGPGSIALNRVTGTSVTNIQGQLTANGQVWIVNPNGVFFGPGAQVNVAGLIATTADIQNSDFLSGNYKFGIGSTNPNASIVNQGTIQASAGGAVLAGAQVTNQGLIVATMGTIALGAGKTFAVDFQGDKLIQFQVTSPVDQTPRNPDGSAVKALVDNSGTLSAQGGTVLLTARAAKGVIDNVINTSGIVEATSAQLVNGEIVLDGGDVGTVTVSGVLDASGKSAGQTGGTVKVLGNQVALAAGAAIDVSGDAGGGTALVGGNFHGSGTEQNAATTTVSAGARINADAITSGTGGNVAVWADGLTSYAGTITARGGSVSGSGGYVETSGKGSLSLGSGAKVDTSAKVGVAGTWLLDPADFTIGASEAATIVTDLLTSNVVIETNPADLTGVNGDIVVNASVIYGSSNALSLLAAGNIIVNASIINTQAANGGAINLVAGWDGTTGFSGGTVGINSPGSLDIGALKTTAGSFGNTTFVGDISIVAGGTAVDVGSASGVVTALGHDLNIQGGTVLGAVAQLGFNPILGTPVSATGDIDVVLTGNLSLLGGSGTQAGAMIGHGAPLLFTGQSNPGDFTLSGNIDVTAATGVTLIGGAGQGAFAQIGHGGYGAFSNSTLGGNAVLGGNISVQGGTGVYLSGGYGSFASAQIGHGGGKVGAGANLGSVITTGDISVGAATILVAGGGDRAFAQIGHGGYAALDSATVAGPVTVGGNISVDPVGLTGMVAVAGGTGVGSFAQIGHGGEYALRGATLGGAGNSVSGSIAVYASGAVLVLGGSNSDASAQIGHGGFRVGSGLSGSSSDITVSGNISVGAGDSLAVGGGTGFYAFAQIGHGGAFAFSNANLASVAIGGSVTATAAADFIMLGGYGVGSFAQIGHGGLRALSSATLSAGGSISGDIAVTALGNANLAGGYGNYSYVQIGHGGAYAASAATLGGGFTESGNIAINVGTTGSALTGMLAMSGNPITGGEGVRSYAQIGHGGAGFLEGASGSVIVTNSGDISVGATQAILLNGGTMPGAFVQIGHGGLQMAMGASGLSVVDTGNISIGVGTTSNPGTLLMTGGYGALSYVQIGHGGALAGEYAGFLGVPISIANQGNIAVNIGTADPTINDGGSLLQMVAGTGDNLTFVHDSAFRGAAYVQIGHGGYASAPQSGSFSFGGNIAVSVGKSGGSPGTVTLSGSAVDSGSNDSYDYAQIGHGGAYTGRGATLSANSTVSGNIDVFANGPISVLGGYGNNSKYDYAQIGHGGAGFLAHSYGYSSSASVSGDINVTAAGGITLQGGSGDYASAQIGHGGYGSFFGGTFQRVGVLGTIDVTAGGALALLGGTYGGPGYSARGSFAQIGHGGEEAFDAFKGGATVSGDISVGAVGNIALFGGSGAYTNAQIGHGGGYAFNGANFTGAGTVLGAISVVAGGSIWLQGGSTYGTSAQIGHGGAGFGRSAYGLYGIGAAGDIAVTALGGSITLAGGSGGYASAQIGHGGYMAFASLSASSGWLTGNVTVAADAGSVVVTSGTGVYAFAQIGHGGAGAFVGSSAVSNPTLSGNVFVQAGADITLDDTAGPYVQIGHGDASEPTLLQPVFLDGNIDLRAGGQLVLNGNPTIARTVQFATGSGILGYTIIEADTILDNGTLGIGTALANNIVTDLGRGDVSVITTSTSTALTVRAPIDASGVDPAGVLNLVAESSVIVNAPVTNGTGAINLIAGWNGTTGLPGFGLGNFNPDTVAITPGAAGNNGGKNQLGADLTTDGAQIRLVGQTVLLTTVTIDTTAGGTTTRSGGIVFVGGIQDSAFRASDLTMIAGSGDILMDAVGTVTQPHGVTIVSANNVTDIAGDIGATASFQAGSLDIVTATGTVGFSGSISTAGTPSSSAALADGGAVTINAAGAVSIDPAGPGAAWGIDTGGAIQFSPGEVAGNGGAITISGASISIAHGVRTAGGDVHVGGNAGNAGAVALTATGTVSLGTSSGVTPGISVEVIGGVELGSSGSGGAAGNVTISGSSVTLGGSIRSFGGGIAPSATSTGDGAAGGSISLTGTSGIVKVGADSFGESIIAAGGDSGLGNGGAAGSIMAQAATLDFAGSVASFGGSATGAGSTGSGGLGGLISLDATSGHLSIGAGSGSGQSVNSVGGGSVGGNAAAGGGITLAGGSITLAGGLYSRGGDVSGASGGRGGDGGGVLISATGNITLAQSNGHSVQTRGGNSNGTGGGGNGAPITITSSGGSINVSGAVTSRGGNVAGASGGGDGASISISAGVGSISIGGSAGQRVAIESAGGNSSASGNGGAGGDISVAAGGVVTISAASGEPSILSGGGNANTGDGGSGGAIVVSGSSVLTGGALISAGGDAVTGPAGGKGGNAGAISITATSGDISIGLSTISPVPGNTFYLSLVARGGDTSGTAGGGMGASVSLSAPSGSITAGVGVPAGTTFGTTSGQTTNGAAITTRGGDDLATGTDSGTGGNAGAITVHASGSVTLGTVTQDDAAAINSSISARGGDAKSGSSTLGTGGNASPIVITGSNLTLAQISTRGGDAPATGTGVGNGADVTLSTTGSTGAITLRGYAQPSPSSNTRLVSVLTRSGRGVTDSGTAGSIVIDGNVVAVGGINSVMELNSFAAASGIAGDITVNGNIAAATGLETIRFTNGAGVIDPGDVGTSTTPVAGFVLSANTGGATFGNVFTTNAILSGDIVASSFQAGGTVSLSNNTTLDTSAGNGSIALGATLVDSAQRAHSILITAGTGDVTFGAVGLNGPQAAGVTIGSARNVTETAADTVTSSPGPGFIQAFRAGALSITASGNVSFVGDISTAAPLNGLFGTLAGPVNGGDVTIVAGGTVAIGTGTPASVGNFSIMTKGADFTTTVGAAGNGGNIVITAKAIDLPNGALARGGDAGAGGSSLTGSAGNGGNSGNVTLTATGSGSSGGITVGAPQVFIDYSSTEVVAAGIAARGGRAFGAGTGGNGGTIVLSAPSSDIIVGQNVTLPTTNAIAFGSAIINASGGAAFLSGDGGTAGSVSITAGGNVVIGTQANGNFLVSQGFAILATGGNAASGNGGDGNSISIQAAAVTLGMGIASDGGNATLGGTGGNGGNAGAISIGATAGDVTLGVSARTQYVGTGTSIANGTATPVALEFFGISARGGDTSGATQSVSGGTGAAIALTATAGSIGPGPITPLNGLGTLPQTGGSILTRGGDNSSTVTGSGGNAGGISVGAGGGVVLAYFAGDEQAILDSTVVGRGGNAPGGTGGNAASVFIQGASLALSGVNASGGTSAATGGSGGVVTLTTTGGTGTISIGALTPDATTTLGAGPSISADGGFGVGSASRTGSAGSIEIDGNVVATVAAAPGAGTPLLSLSAIGTGAPTLTVNGNVDASASGAEALAILAHSGSIVLSGDIGVGKPFATVFIDPVAVGGITLGGGGVTHTIHTTADQEYVNPVVLLGDEMLISDSGNVKFDSSINGAFTLGITALGAVDFLGPVGGGTPLANLIVTAGSILAGSINTVAGPTLITTAGSTLTGTLSTTNPVTFGGAVILTGDALIDTTGGGVSPTGADIKFFGNVDGAHTLSLDAGTAGAVFFGGVVGGLTPLAALVVDPSAITLSNSVHTTGSQTYAAPVLLVGNVTATSTSGSITFQSTVDGAFALSVAASAGTGTAVFDGLVGSNSALASLAATAATITLSGVTTGGNQVYTGAIELAGLYTTQSGNISINGPAHLTSATTIDPGAGTLTISGSVTGSSSLAVFGSGIADFGSSLDLGTGALDLSAKSAGSVTVHGPVNLGALDTGEGNYAISFLGGGTIADPVFTNGGGVTFAGDFLFPGGLTVSALALAGDTSVNGETSGVTLGTVNQGGNQLVVIADSISLTGAWTGTGNRVVAAFSPIGIALGGATALGAMSLDQTELDFLANGGAAPVLIGSGLNGAITANSFTFDAPLTLLGASITINGTLSKSTGGLVLEAVQAVNNTLTLGAIAGSVSLAGGTGPLAVQAASVTLTGSTVNGDPGTTGSIVNQMQFITPPTPGPGPYTVDGFDFSPSQTPTLTPGNPPPDVVPVLIPPTNPNLNTSPNSTTIEDINLVIQTSIPGATSGTTQGGSQSSTDTGTGGTGTLADQAGGQIGGGGQGGGTPDPTPSSSGNTKPIVPNLFLHTSTGLGGGTGAGGAGGALGNPPSQ